MRRSQLSHYKWVKQKLRDAQIPYSLWDGNMQLAASSLDVKLPGPI